MRKKNIVLLAGLIVLVSSVSFFSIYITNLSEHKDSTSFQKFVSCSMRLETIGEQIDDYRKEFDCSPPNLEVLFPITQTELIRHTTIDGASNYQGGECHYIYRGADLDVNIPKEMILAYDKLRNHEGFRNVLFAKPLERIFYIDSDEVSEDKYNKFCKKILRAYDPNIRMEITGNGLLGDPNLNSFILDSSLYTEERYRMISENFLSDYDSGDFLINISTKAQSFDGWEGRAWFQDIRVISLSGQKFKKAIQRDNDLRKELVLPQKQVLD